MFLAGLPSSANFCRIVVHGECGDRKKKWLSTVHADPVRLEKFKTAKRAANARYLARRDAAEAQVLKGEFMDSRR